MIKSANKQVIKKGQFECAFCKADHCAQPNYLDDMPLQVSKFARKELEDLVSKPMIFCQNHPQKVISKYCSHENTLHCKDCALERHTSHMQHQKDVVFEAVSKFLNDSSASLSKVVDKI